MKKFFCLLIFPLLFFSACTDYPETVILAENQAIESDFYLQTVPCLNEIDAYAKTVNPDLVLTGMEMERGENQSGKAQIIFENLTHMGEWQMLILQYSPADKAVTYGEYTRNTAEHGPAVLEELDILESRLCMRDTDEKAERLLTDCGIEEYESLTVSLEPNQMRYAVHTVYADVDKPRFEVVVPFA